MRALALTAAALLAAGCLTVRPASTERVLPTPDRLARGAYLAEAVMGCATCHSPRRWELHLAPVQRDAFAAGGDTWGPDQGYPGEVTASNLTPDPDTGLGKATDGELLRALREGIGHDGRGLFPSMPYRVFRELSDEDARALVTWMRALPPIRRAVPRTRIDFPVSLFIQRAPRPLEGPVPEPGADALARGRYLSRMAQCHECHTPKDGRGRKLEGKDFAGGALTKAFGFVALAPNLTPAPGTWMSTATAEQFVARFAEWKGYEASPRPRDAAAGTLMPWSDFAQLSPEDLAALYAYLKSLPPLPTGP